MRRGPTGFVLRVVGCMSLACGGCSDGPSAPGPIPAVNVTGFWRGTIRSEAGTGGLANISANLSQSGGVVTGTFGCATGTIACSEPGGAIRGTVTGTIFTAQLQFPDGRSCEAFNGTISGDSMNGNYSCLDLPGSERGSWNLTRSQLIGTELVRETLAGVISAAASPPCSSAFERSVDASYYRGGTERCAEFPRSSHTAGPITATLTWQD